MDTIKRRKSSVGSNPTDVSLGFSGAGRPPAIPEARSSAQEMSLMSPPPIPEPRRARPLSLVSKSNRLSISFPVQPSGTMSPGRQTPTGRHTPTQSLTIPSSATANQTSVPSPQDSAGFMVALAAQERKVFELREELNRAEAELKNLKSHWAIHEANKKRADIKQVQRLESMQFADANQWNVTGLGDEDVARRSAELDRRKAILAAGITKDSRRKIITGGHTRALSLLSPDRSPHGPSFDSIGERQRDSLDSIRGIPRKMTMPDTRQGLTRISSDRARHSYQGGATVGVKQIAEDLKAGLWTFMEDLRQATVGEEAMQRPSIGVDANRATDGLGNITSNGSARNVEQSRNRSPMTRKSTSKDRGTGQTTETILIANRPAPQTKPALPSTPPSKNTITVPTTTVDDDWSNWDSPSSSKGASPRWSNSTTLSSDDASEPGISW